MHKNVCGFLAATFYNLNFQQLFYIAQKMHQRFVFILLRHLIHDKKAVDEEIGQFLCKRIIVWFKVDRYVNILLAPGF